MLRYSGVILFAFILPLPTPLLVKTLALIVMLLNLLVVDRREFLPKELLTKSVVILFALFFLTDTINGLVNESIFVIRELKLAFLIIPVIFFWKNQSLKKVKTYVELAFVVGVFIYIIYAWAYAIYFYTLKYPHYEFNLFNDYTRYIFYHYLPGTIDHNYLGMYLFLAAIIIYKSAEVVRAKWRIVLILLLVVNMPFLGGKTMIVITLVFSLALILLELNKKGHFSFKKKLVSLVITALLLFGSVVVMANWFPNSLRSSIEKREAIYACAIEGSKALFWKGIGFKNIEEISDYCANYNLPFKPHSIFLDELLSNGFFGLILLLIMIGYLLKVAIESKDAVFIALIIVGIIIGTVESIFSRQWGVFFFVFFSSFYAAIYSNFDPKIKNV